MLTEAFVLAFNDLVAQRAVLTAAPAASGAAPAPRKKLPAMR